MSATCECCDQPLETVDHADAYPARAYCQLCSACHRLPADEACDSCYAAAQGNPAHAAQLLAAASAR